jgi:hypothetical protein
MFLPTYQIIDRGTHRIDTALRPVGLHLADASRAGESNHDINGRKHAWKDTASTLFDRNPELPYKEACTRNAVPNAHQSSAPTEPGRDRRMPIRNVSIPRLALNSNNEEHTDERWRHSNEAGCR